MIHLVLPERGSLLDMRYHVAEIQLTYKSNIKLSLQAQKWIHPEMLTNPFGDFDSEKVENGRTI